MNKIETVFYWIRIIGSVILVLKFVKLIYEQFMARWIAVEWLTKDMEWLRRKGKISEDWTKDTGGYNLEQFRADFIAVAQKIVQQATTVIPRTPLLNIGMADNRTLNPRYTTFFKVLDPNFRRDIPKAAFETQEERANYKVKLNPLLYFLLRINPETRKMIFKN